MSGAGLLFFGLLISAVGALLKVSDLNLALKYMSSRITHSKGCIRPVYTLGTRGLPMRCNVTCMPALMTIFLEPTATKYWSRILERQGKQAWQIMHSQILGWFQDASTGVRRAQALRKKMNTVDAYAEARELPDILRQEMCIYYQDVWVSHDGPPLFLPST